jgi:hypothetical protein
MILDYVAMGVFIAAFLIGLRSTFRIHRIRKLVDHHNRILYAFDVVCLVITIAAGFYGFLGIRRVLGFDSLPGVAVISVVVASAVLLIPLFLDWTVTQIRRDE